MKLYPQDPNYPTGAKRAIARLTYARVVRDRGEDAPAAHAALGRMLYHGGDGYEPSVLEDDDTTIESVAWHRESGRWIGFMNRSMRKHVHTPQ